MKMIFGGDVACSTEEDTPQLIIPNDIKKANWIFNLEGSIVRDNEADLLKKNVLFNSLTAIDKIKQNLNIKGVTLANNHITDLGKFHTTLSYLKKNKILYTGAGFDFKTSSKPIYFKEQEQEITILNFGWEAINCIVSKKNKDGVNPYTNKNVLNQFILEKEKKPKNKIIIYFHWNYELELYPQPNDRDLARKLIDLGADLIIGCHAHRVQGAEIYKEKPILYGLGNWMFCQKTFWNSTLTYPDFCNTQLAFEVDWLNNNFICHWFDYDKEQNIVNYKESELLKDSIKIKELTPFTNFSSKEYEKWFKKNRIQKKLLPVFCYSDSKLSILFKTNWIKLRHQLIMILLRFRIKK